MGRIATFDRAAVAELQALQDGLISRDQAKRCGVSEKALRYRIRPGGSWQVVLPGVYLASTGKPSFRQMQLAALLYAGPGSVLTGNAAMANHGLPVRDFTEIAVLIPAARSRRDVAFVRVCRTYRMPASYCDRQLRFAPVARAVIDAARLTRDIGEVRQIVAWPVQMGKARIDELAKELASGPRAGSALIRKVLAEVADGVRSAAEGYLRDLIKKAKLPEPFYNPDLFSGQEFIARPDAWWPTAGVAVEVDSKEWHLSPADWSKTMARHAKMSAHGIVVLHYPPARLRDEAKALAAQIRSALDNGRELPGIRTVPVGQAGTQAGAQAGTRAGTQAGARAGTQVGRPRALRAVRESS